MKRTLLTAILITASALILAGYGYGQMQSPYLGRPFKSLGEQLYYTGIGGNGYPIPFYGGPMWLRMHGGGCVSCHGINGRGGVPIMMGGRELPTDIRYKVLTGKEKHLHEGKEEEHHYTDALIKRAITQGLEADGKVMDWTMPRWRMSETDLNALIEYLKTLD